VGQIGDTIAVVRGPSGYRLLDPAPRFEYANETSFVTDEGALRELRITVLEAGDVDEIVLSTDGLRLKILDLAAAAPYQPFFEDLSLYARTPAATSDAIRVFLEKIPDQTGDDKSLVMAVRDIDPTGDAA